MRRSGDSASHSDVGQVTEYDLTPAEIEELLLTHPAVSQCAVIGVAWTIVVILALHRADRRVDPSPGV